MCRRCKVKEHNTRIHVSVCLRNAKHIQITNYVIIRILMLYATPFIARVYFHFRNKIIAVNIVEAIEWTRIRVQAHCDRSSTHHSFGREIVSAWRANSNLCSHMIVAQNMLAAWPIIPGRENKTANDAAAYMSTHPSHGEQILFLQLCLLKYIFKRIPYYVHITNDTEIRHTPITLSTFCIVLCCVVSLLCISRF